MPFPPGGEIVACLSGAVLAEVLKPAETWRASLMNLVLGIAGGWYVPDGVEAYVPTLKGARQLVVFVSAFIGAAVLRWLHEMVRERKFVDFFDGLKRAADALRTPKSPGGG